MKPEKVMQMIRDKKYDELLKLCEKEIMETEIKTSGGNAELRRHRAAMKVINSNDDRLDYAFVDGGMQYICDGCMAVRLPEEHHISGLPGPKDYQTPPDFKRLFPSNMIGDEFRLEASEVKKLSKISGPWAKKNRKRLLRFYANGISWNCDVKLLERVVDLLGCDEFTIHIPEKAVSPALISCSIGDAILLPVRVKVPEEPVAVFSSETQK